MVARGVIPWVQQGSGDKLLLSVSLMDIFPALLPFILSCSSWVAQCLLGSACYLLPLDEAKSLFLVEEYHHHPMKPVMIIWGRSWHQLFAPCNTSGSALWVDWWWVCLPLVSPFYLSNLGSTYVTVSMSLCKSQCFFFACYCCPGLLWGPDLLLGITIS